MKLTISAYKIKEEGEHNLILGAFAVDDYPFLCLLEYDMNGFKEGLDAETSLPVNLYIIDEKNKRAICREQAKVEDTLAAQIAATLYIAVNKGKFEFEPEDDSQLSGLKDELAKSSIFQYAKINDIVYGKLAEKLNIERTRSSAAQLEYDTYKALRLRQDGLSLEAAIEQVIKGSDSKGKNLVSMLLKGIDKNSLLSS
jgi:hypothetical protein